MDPTALHIASANVDQLPVVFTILVEAAEWHVSLGLDQWWPELFTQHLRQTIERQVREGSVYLASLSGEHVGTLTLTWTDEDVWGVDDGAAGYVHRLAVRRAWAGRGVGRAMLDWAGQHCAASGKRWLRLDTMAANAVLRAYYERLGFSFRGVNESVRWKAARYQRPAYAVSPRIHLTPT